MYLNMVRSDKEPAGWVMISMVKVTYVRRSHCLSMFDMRSQLCPLLWSFSSFSLWVLELNHTFTLNFQQSLPLEMSQEDPNIHTLFRVKDCDLK